MPRPTGAGKLPAITRGEGTHANDAPHPHHDPQVEEKFSQLAQAIAHLNATEKAVITLFLEDLSYEQMAEVLGVTENNIGVMLHRAKKKLSTLMKEDPCTTTP